MDNNQNINLILAKIKTFKEEFENLEYLISTDNPLYKENYQKKLNSLNESLNKKEEEIITLLKNNNSPEFINAIQKIEPEIILFYKKHLNNN